MRNTWIVRAPERGDVDEIVRLCAAHAKYERAAYEPHAKAYKLNELMFGRSPRLHCLVVARENAVALAGYATWSAEISTWNADTYAHMDCIYLEQDARGHGLGRRLVSRIAFDALAGGHRLMQWQTPVFNDNAVTFYEHLGACRLQKYRFFLQEDAMIGLAG